MLDKMTNKQRLEVMRAGEFSKQIKESEDKVDRFANVLIDQFSYTADQIKNILISTCGGSIDLESEKHRDLCVIAMQELVQLECMSRFNGKMTDLGNDKDTSPAIILNIFAKIGLVLDGEVSSFITTEEVELVRIFNREVDSYA